MDIVKALRELYAEKKRLDAAIALLEARRKGGVSGPAAKNGKRRGRKSMSAAERQEVSRRMTLYWETRRAGLRRNASADEQASSSLAS